MQRYQICRQILWPSLGTQYPMKLMTLTWWPTDFNVFISRIRSWISTWVAPSIIQPNRELKQADMGSNNCQTLKISCRESKISKQKRSLRKSIRNFSYLPTVQCVTYIVWVFMQNFPNTDSVLVIVKGIAKYAWNFDNVTTADPSAARRATDNLNWEFTEVYVIGGHFAASSISRILYANYKTIKLCQLSKAPSGKRNRSDKIWLIKQSTIKSKTFDQQFLS